MPTAPHANVGLPAPPPIVEARATVPAVADHIELDLAPLVAAAAALREAIRAAPQSVPESIADGAVDH